MKLNWSVVYEGAWLDNGELLFPEKLDELKLNQLRKTMGTYKFANQYLNVTIPDSEQDFKKSWIKHYQTIPENTHTFIFIDPAISLEDGADFTATVIVQVDCLGNWYVTHAIRQKITATETVDWIFKLNKMFTPFTIGIEDVAYQKALFHFVQDRMIRTNEHIPLKPIKRSVITQSGKRSNNSKPFRIRSLIPFFEFGRILLNQGLDDLILEYSQFPRGKHDDLLDALASIEEIVVYPEKPKEIENVTNPQDPRYESNYIKQLVRNANSRNSSSDDY